MRMDETTDALLADLNGGMAVPMDDIPPQSLGQTETLTVGGRSSSSSRGKAVSPPPLPVAAAGYEITVVGDYLAWEGGSNIGAGKKVKRPYSIKVRLATLDAALSVIKQKLLDRMLRATYPDYADYLTHVIDHVEPLSDDMPPPDNVLHMSYVQLVEVVRAKKLPLQPAEYMDDVSALRAAVADCLLNPGRSPDELAKREDARRAERQQEAKLMALNPVLLPPQQKKRKK